jgi:NaMN:DMB phosphoribosyltransferase
MSTALMIRIDYTSGPTITMTAKKDLTLAAKTVDINTREIVSDAPVNVAAGTVLYFVESSLPGWYYIGRVEHNRASCSCPARKPCKHMAVIMAQYTAKIARREVFVFRVGSATVAGATAAEALLKALSLVKPVVVSEMSGVCPESVKVSQVAA